jgi:hypothetical protein
MSGVTEALVWDYIPLTTYQAKGEAFSYVISEVEGHFAVSAFTPGGPIDMDVQVALAVEPTLEDAKQAAQLWESNGPTPKTRPDRVRVYFRGYVEYHVTDSEKLVEAMCHEWAGGGPEDKKVGSLIGNTAASFRRKNLFAIAGTEAEAMRVTAGSVQPATEGPHPI